VGYVFVPDGSSWVAALLQARRRLLREPPRCWPPCSA